MKEGLLDRACAALAASQRLDPATGTLINLARCYELSGRMASAWATYAEAEAMSLREGNEGRAEAAGKLRQAVATRVVRVQIVGTESAVEVEIDGRKLLEEELRLTHPMDTGKHVVTWQEGESRFKQNFEVPFVAEGKQAETLTVTLVAKAAHRVATAPSGTARQSTSESREEPSGVPAEAPAAETGKSYRGLGFTLLGTGLGVAAVSGYFIIDAFSDASDAACNENDECTPAGQEQRKDAQTQLGIGYGVGALGVVLGVSGAILLATSQRPTPHALRLDGDVGRDGFGLRLSGSF